MEVLQNSFLQHLHLMFHKQMECKALILRIKGAYHSLDVKQISLDCCPAYLHWRIAQLQYNDRFGFKYCSHFLSFHLTRFFERQDLCRERIDSQSVCKSHRFTPFSAYSFISASIYNKFVHSSLFSSENVRYFSDFFPRNLFFVLYNSENFPRNFVSVGRLWESSRISPLFVRGLVLNPCKIH